MSAFDFICMPSRLLTSDALAEMLVGGTVIDGTSVDIKSSNWQMAII